MDKIPPGSQRNTLVNALRAFQEYLGSCRPELALPLDRFNSWRSQTPVSVGIISSQEYQRALKKLGLGPTLDTRMLRIMLILGFRTGLRFHEIFGLTVNDFIVPDDVEANDAFEMIVRRNRERHTKTELSRRILPLHLLLNHESSSGISELVEVRMWVDHRRKEAELTGRNRMFVNPAWPSVRPPHIVTKSRLSVLLKDVSGDERVSFDTLRHSFTSYLLTTMLLPDDAGITLFPLAFTPDLVSASRRERVAGSLLGEGRIGQASVHAVSQLCGHAPVSTTLQWYSHLLDWTLGAYVDRRTVQVGLTFGDAAGHTTMTVAALRKLVQRSRGKAVSQLRLTRGQSEPYRPVLTIRPERGRGSSQIEKPCSVYLDEVLIAATRKIAKDAHAAGTPIVVWSERVTRRPQRSFKIVSKVAFRRLDWRHIKASLEADRMGYNIENFARRENYPYPMLEGWIAEARRFRSARRPDGRLRHLTANANCKNDCDLDGSFPRPPAKGHETRVADRLWSAATGLSDPRLQKALAIFRDCYDGQRNEIQPTTLADARSLAGLLTSLELTLDTAATAGSDILVRHYPGHAKTTESRYNILAMLAGAKKSGGRWHGRLTFTPVRKASEGTGYGLRFILTMLTIALGRHDDVQEGLFIKGFSEKRNPIERGETDLMQKGEWVRDYPLDMY